MQHVHQLRVLRIYLGIFSQYKFKSIAYYIICSYIDSAVSDRSYMCSRRRIEQVTLAEYMTNQAMAFQPLCTTVIQSPNDLGSSYYSLEKRLIEKGVEFILSYERDGS